MLDNTAADWVCLRRLELSERGKCTRIDNYYIPMDAQRRPVQLA